MPLRYPDGRRGDTEAGMPDDEFTNSSGTREDAGSTMAGGGFMLRNRYRQIIGIAAAALVYGGMLMARQHEEDKQLLSKLSGSRHTLADGVAQAEKAAGDRKSVV